MGYDRNNTVDLVRTNRLKERLERKNSLTQNIAVNSLIEEIEEVRDDEDVVDFSISANSDKCIQTDLACEESILNFKDQDYGSEKWFIDDDKTSFFTGLPTTFILKTVFNLVVENVNHDPRSSLSQFQQFTMMLMRLKLNVPLQLLAYHFNISKPTVSKLVNKWIEISFVKLSPLIIWPGREQLVYNTPMCFRQHFKTTVAVIIDCFEVKCQQSSNLMSRALTYSSYKHNNTAKILIGISPQGTICFISKCWGGRASDKLITENCGILNKLLPGDTILADRGFDIADSAAIYCAKVEIPAFTKGKKQLCPLDVEKTRKIASVRIHVERVIGLLRRKYTILGSETLPKELLLTKDDDNFAMIDKIVLIASALTNLCDSIIPLN